MQGDTKSVSKPSEFMPVGLKSREDHVAAELAAVGQAHLAIGRVGGGVDHGLAHPVFDPVESIVVRVEEALHLAVAVTVERVGMVICCGCLNRGSPWSLTAWAVCSWLVLVWYCSSRIFRDRNCIPHRLLHVHVILTAQDWRDQDRAGQPTPYPCMPCRACYCV